MNRRKFREKYAAWIEFVALSAWIAFLMLCSAGFARVVFP